MAPKITSYYDKAVFEVLDKRYCAFIDNVNDESKPAIKVYDDLTKKQMEELQMIREISKDLQAKKDDDMRKAAQAAEEMALAKEEAKTAEVAEETDKKQTEEKPE